LKVKLAWLIWVMPLTVFAQNPALEDYTLLGAGLRTRPAYDGSASQTVDVIPVVRYYGDILFARTTQGIFEGGARTRLAPGLAIGAQVAYQAGRHKSESSFLRDRDVPDVSDNASVGAHIEWDTQIGPAPFNLLGRFRQNVDSDRGAQADLRASLGVYGGHGIKAGVFTQGTWADSKSVRTYYDTSGSGLLYVAAGLEGGYDLARHWVIVSTLEGRRLQGDAASSPLAERRSSWYLSAGVAYRF
jgi:outer membrane scaffolding protein for murein synthesis (MipA/OmpV family)